MAEMMDALRESERRCRELRGTGRGVHPVSKISKRGEPGNLCNPRAGQDFGPYNIATYYLTNSRRKTMINSGSITAFSGFIASARKGGEVKLVQRGILRARIFYPEKRGRRNRLTTERVITMGRVLLPRPAPSQQPRPGTRPSPRPPAVCPRGRSRPAWTA